MMLYCFRRVGGVICDASPRRGRDRWNRHHTIFLSLSPFSPGVKPMLVVLPTICLLVLLAVGIHYNTLIWLSSFLQGRKINVRRWVAASILGLLVAHVIEIFLFAAGFEMLEKFGHYGELSGKICEQPLDYCYFSFTSYTSLGFGDIVPSGWLRMMTGIETLTGLILIAWSASFLFMQMERHWEPGELNK